MNPNKSLGIMIITLLVLSVFAACTPVTPDTDDFLEEGDEIVRFSSEEEIKEAFKDLPQTGGLWSRMKVGMDFGIAETAAMPTSDSATSTNDFSTTNIQVEGVDEADIIKTDGEYIYVVAQNKLYIARAYPDNEAKILAEVNLKDLAPQELFIHGDRLLVFGRTQFSREILEETQDEIGKPIADIEVAEIMPYPRQWSTGVTVKLFDIENKENPEELRTVDFEGSYITSRKIGEEVYFVINSYPRHDGPIIPLVREGNEKPTPIAKATDIGYILPLQAQNFITVASISMTDEDKALGKEVIVGSGRNVYASQHNLYIAQVTYPRHENIGEPAEDSVVSTVISKFALNNGEIKFQNVGKVKGTILNQFSMDEFEENFRIATTIRGYSNNVDTSTNNLYVLNKKMEQIGEVEEIAPGESIFSVRFMGKRAYMVTFKHIDPLFVIDLADPENPKILGKLKIPGYSDYLHPFDETHLIGIGKEVDASIDADKIHTEHAVYYTAIQGVKLAIFDVSDVENPIEMYKEVIGARGTESLATKDHKAFLFDKARELLVVPMTVAELNEGQDKSQQGHFTFQGAYVYNLNLEDGFQLRGKVSHYDEDDQAFIKSGYSFRGSSGIKRSLYINNVLYTLSNSKLQLNDLDSLETLKTLEFQ